MNAPNGAAVAIGINPAGTLTFVNLLAAVFCGLNGCFRPGKMRDFVGGLNIRFSKVLHAGKMLGFVKV